MVEQCNCEQAIDYRKKARTLALYVLRWSKLSTGQRHQGLSDFQILAEKAVPMAHEIFETVKYDP